MDPGILGHRDVVRIAFDDLRPHRGARAFRNVDKHELVARADDHRAILGSSSELGTGEAGMLALPGQ